MTKVVISGYGRMGRMVEKVLSGRGVECAGKSESIQDFDRDLARECICIDFTTPAAFRANYRFLASAFKGVVVGTTGWNDISEDVFAAFRKEGTPLVYASNFSIGVNVLFEAVRQMSALLSQAGYEPYVLEMHHKHKLDAPSGTAVSIASAIREAGHYADVPVSSVRCGEIPGIHEACFEGTCDRISIRHEAFSREGFASGAVQAALWCDSLGEGVYEFAQLLREKTR